MNTMAPEPLPETGEPVEIQTHYTWHGGVLTVSVERGSAKLAVELDWSSAVDDDAPPADLFFLVTALPGIMEAVREHVENG